MTRGTFITFEGGEGTGKSTQIRLLRETLESAGSRVRSLREPGGTRVGEVVRDLVLDPAHDVMTARAELLLYEASRAQLVAEVIEPALNAGEVVLCDRYFDSSTAYQGYARGLSLEDVHALNAFATGGLTPDRTVVLDLDPGHGLSRATDEGADRLESEEIAFHERLREGYLALAAEEPERFRVVDATGSAEEVAARVQNALADLPGIGSALGRRV